MANRGGDVTNRRFACVMARRDADFLCRRCANVRTHKHARRVRTRLHCRGAACVWGQSGQSGTTTGHRRRNPVPETQAGSAITPSSVFRKRVVRIAIEPALARLRRCDNRMPRRARVLRRVTVGRVVAAMRATALLTGTEMNPGSADLDALLALPSFWVLDAGNGSDVDTALIGHDILLRAKHVMHKGHGDRPLADG